MQPLGPFDLHYQNRYFNGWPALVSDKETIVMCFPVEGWSGSAAVTLHQCPDGSIDIATYGTGDEASATTQALSAISLD
jgi:hypothetical protein